MNINPRLDFCVQPGADLTGRLTIPGDKSISHRALILGAIAQGTTHITGFLDGEDTITTLSAFRQMGVRIERPAPHEVIVHGVGLDGLQAPSQALNLANSGTSVRLLAGLLAGQAFDSELCGDASLMQRPMRRITEPLRQMNANIRCSETGTLPIVIGASNALQGIHYKMPVASAQLKSSLLLAGLYASGKTCVTEPAVTRDHTERMLRHFGGAVRKTQEGICIERQPLLGKPIEVPADISSAAFFMVAACIVEGADLLLPRIGINPTRHAVIEILQSMGADIKLENTQDCCGEPVADIHIRHSALHAINIPAHLVPIAIDEFPAILIAAAYAEGETVLTGAAELRVKESDRIQAMTAGLRALAIDVTETDDGMRVKGGRPSGGIVDSYTDHRIAMAFTVAGLAASGPITVHDCANVSTSFPGFVDAVSGLGIVIDVSHASNG